MALETIGTKSLQSTKGSAQVVKTHTAQYDMAGDDMVDGTLIIPTTWTAINLGSITGVPAEILIINADATNYLQLAVANDDTGIFAKLLAGRSAQWPPSTDTIYAKANTASVRIVRVAVEA